MIDLLNAVPIVGTCIVSLCLYYNNNIAFPSNCGASWVHVHVRHYLFILKGELCMQSFGIMNNVEVFPLSWKVHVIVDCTMEPLSTEHNIINLSM